MNLQLLIGFLLTLLPISELRGGLPVIVEYCISRGLSVWPYFVVVLILNVLVIFLIFLFFDFLHESFMRIGFYRRAIGNYILRMQKKSDKVKRSMNKLGYLALLIFVAVPLPGTGAWTGTFIAWILGLNRVKSFVSIALGVIIAGFLVLFASFGFFSWLL